jgi:chromosome segregation ATPase
MKYFLFVLGLLLLPSCTQLLSLPKQPVPAAQLCFSQAMDDFSAEERVTQLQRCTKNFPASDWSVRARTLIDLNERLRKCRDERAALADQSKQDQERIERLQQELVEQNLRLPLLEQEHAEQQQQLQLLEQENAALVETLEQLKGVLIELEQRP